MKHHHNADANVTVRVEIPTADILTVINQVTDAAVIVIAAATVGGVLVQTAKVWAFR